MNYFTASYTSILSSPVFKSTINSVEDLSKSTTIKTLLNKGSSTEELIMVSSSSLLLTYSSVGILKIVFYFSHHRIPL